MQIEEKSMRIIENAIELASDCIEALQEHCNVGRDSLIHNYIIPWAIEAESTYQSQIAIKADVPYYDFIIKFGEMKLMEVISDEA